MASLQATTKAVGGEQPEPRTQQHARVALLAQAPTAAPAGASEPLEVTLPSQAGQDEVHSSHRGPRLTRRSPGAREVLLPLFVGYVGDWAARGRPLLPGNVGPSPHH